MRALKIRTFLLSVSVLLLVAASAVAQGVIVPGECDRCPGPRPQVLPRSLPIKSIKIDAKIGSQVATTHIEQIFRNDTTPHWKGPTSFRFPNRRPFPNSQSGTATAGWLARCVRARKRAASITRLSAANAIPACLSTPARIFSRRASFPSRRIPTRNWNSRTARFARRVRHRRLSLSAWYRQANGPDRLSLGRVEIESNDPLRNIYSPTHAIEVKRNGTGRASVTFENQG